MWADLKRASNWLLDLDIQVEQSVVSVGQHKSGVKICRSWRNGDLRAAGKVIQGHAKLKVFLKVSL